MSLNKVLLLDEQKLLSLLKSNNQEDIASIVQSKHLDGKLLLELSEFQTIKWKLSPAQNKTLFAFIKSVKEDPYILIKKPPANKPKPNLPLTQKPSTLSLRPPQVKPLKPPQPPPTTNHEEVKLKPKMQLPQTTHKNETLVKSTRKPPAITPEKFEDVDYEDLGNTYDKDEAPNAEYLVPNELNEEKNESIEPENTYEPAPDVNRRARNMLQTTPANIATRAPIPVPTEEDEELPNEKMINLKNNIRTIGGYLNIDVEEAEAEINKGLPPTGKKYTVNDLTNIIIVDDEETKRPVNFLEKINKFFTIKSKSTKADSSNYENHMLRSEMPAVELPQSVRNRPLPEIPSTLNKKRATTVKPRQRISPHRRELEEELPLPAQDKGRRSPRRQPERDTEEKVIKDIKRMQSERKKSVVKVVNNPKPASNEDEELLVYENSDSLKTSTSSRNSISPLPMMLTDELAAKLSEKLKARASAFNPGIQDTEDQPVYGNIDEDPAKDQGEENDQPIYGNVDDDEELEDNNNEDEGEDEDNVEDEDEEEQEVYVDSIFNINNERFYRNTDRKGAKQLLRALPNGSFLFRPSERYFLVLTLKADDKYYNLGIERTSTNKIRLNADASSVSPEFGTLRAFVDYFKKEPVTFNHANGLVEVLLNPSLPADLF